MLYSLNDFGPVSVIIESTRIQFRFSGHGTVRKNKGKTKIELSAEALTQLLDRLALFRIGGRGLEKSRSDSYQKLRELAGNGTD